MFKRFLWLPAYKFTSTTSAMFRSLLNKNYLHKSTNRSILSFVLTKQKSKMLTITSPWSVHQCPQLGQFSVVNPAVPHLAHSIVTTLPELTGVEMIAISMFMGLICEVKSLVLSEWREERESMALYRRRKFVLNPAFDGRISPDQKSLTPQTPTISEESLEWTSGLL